MKNIAKKASSKAMAEEVLTELLNCPYRMFRLLQRLKTDSEKCE